MYSDPSLPNLEFSTRKLAMAVYLATFSFISSTVIKLTFSCHLPDLTYLRGLNLRQQTKVLFIELLKFQHIIEVPLVECVLRIYYP